MRAVVRVGAYKPFDPPAALAQGRIREDLSGVVVSRAWRHCANGVRDGDERAVDCGAASVCGLCGLRQLCTADADCECGVCGGGVCGGDARLGLPINPGYRRAKEASRGEEAPPRQTDVNLLMIIAGENNRAIRGVVQNVTGAAAWDIMVMRLFSLNQFLAMGVNNEGRYISKKEAENMLQSVGEFDHYLLNSGYCSSHSILSVFVSVSFALWCFL